MSMFDGQYGGFGGGFIGGPAGSQTRLPGMQFGGGFLMNPGHQAAPVQSVPMASQGGVTYAAPAGHSRPKDRSGRAHPHSQKRY